MPWWLYRRPAWWQPTRSLRQQEASKLYFSFTGLHCVCFCTTRKKVNTCVFILQVFRSKCFYNMHTCDKHSTLWVFEGELILKTVSTPKQESERTVLCGEFQLNWISSLHKRVRNLSDCVLISGLGRVSVYVRALCMCAGFLENILQRADF